MFGILHNGDASRFPPTKTSMVYMKTARNYRYYWMTCFLLGEDYQDKLKKSLDFFYKVLPDMKKLQTWEDRFVMLYAMVLLDDHKRDVLETFAKPESEQECWDSDILDLDRAFFCESFVLSNYLLGRYDAITKREMDFVSLEQTFGGNEGVYSSLTLGIISLIESDKESLIAHVESILAEHKQMECYRDTMQGDICLQAVVLVKLARKTGLDLEFNDRMVPEKLINRKLS